MRKFADCIKRISETKRPVFVAFNLAFDWSLVNYYFVMFSDGYNLFAISGIDAESVCFGKTGCTWSEASKTHIIYTLGLRLDHTHNALYDAKEQAIISKESLDRLLALHAIYNSSYQISCNSVDFVGANLSSSVIADAVFNFTNFSEADLSKKMPHIMISTQMLLMF